MEAFVGFEGFEKICFSGKFGEQAIHRVGNRILDLLFGAYESSRTTLTKPNLVALYVGRIEERLQAAAKLDTDFAKILNRQLIINDEEFDTPWSYLEVIASRLQTWEPSFTTFVHGDPNPENVLVKEGAAGVEVRFIDTKEWPAADYLFDVGKLLHYLAVTGPAERGAEKSTASVDAAASTIRYALPFYGAVAKFIAHAEERLARFAIQKLADPQWEARYALSMASNLLGLPAGRFEKKRRDSAFITYAEGLRWLKRLASRA
jgi:hypothetical protein